MSSNSNGAILIYGKSRFGYIVPPDQPQQIQIITSAVLTLLHIQGITWLFKLETIWATVV